MSRARTVAFLLAGSFICLPATLAHAEDKQACLAAFDKAQQLRIDGRLRAARVELALCARSECPVLVRQDCATWLNDVMGSLPSVVVGARDGRGKDLIAVRVLVDGVEVASALDGKPILVDPGAHKFRYETAGTLPVEEQVLIREGERNRHLTVNFTPPKTDEPKRDPKGLPHASSDDNSSSGAPVASYVLFGVGAVALGGALYFDLTANGDAKTLRDVCAPFCHQEDVDAVQTKYVAAAVSLGVGVVAIGVATYLLLARSSDAPKRAGSAWNFVARF